MSSTVIDLENNENTDFVDVPQYSVVNNIEYICNKISNIFLCFCEYFTCCLCTPVYYCMNGCYELFQHNPFCCLLLVLFIFIGLPVIIWGSLEKSTYSPSMMPTMNYTKYNYTSTNSSTF